MVSVLVPTLNERANIGELVERTLAVFSRLDGPAELVVVDDASPDGTAQAARDVANALGAEARVRVLVRTRDPGLAKAVTEGIAAARGDLLVVMDADLSHPPELIPDLVRAARAQGVSCAVASRYVPGGGTEGWPWARRTISRGACWLARPLVRVKDATSGFFAFRRECVEGVELVPRGYKIGLEILVKGHVEKPVEVPFTFRDRTRGASKLGRGVIVGYLHQLADLYRHQYPTMMRYLQFCLVGLGGMGVDWLTFQTLYHGAGLARLGAMAGGLWAQLGSFGVAVGFNFALNRAWTFRDRAAGARLAPFVLACAGGLALRFAVFAGVVRTGGLVALPVEQAALLCGIVAASIWNFWASARWAFPDRGEATATPWDRTDRWAVGLIAGLGAFRLVFAAVTPLAGDEAYYWQWSRHLAWGYFDHPPLVAYLIAAGARVAGIHPLGVRLGAVGLSAAAGWWLYALSRDAWGSGRVGLWALAAASATPLFAAGALIITPDTPLLAFWTVSVMLALRSVRSGRTRDWALLGATLGLGFLSKYPMVLLPPALATAFAFTPRGRQALRSPGPYLALAVAGFLCLPYVTWHLRNGLGPVLFQLRHGLGPAAGGLEAATGIRTFAEFLGGQAGVLTPVLFLFAGGAVGCGARALVRRVRGTGTDPRVPGDLDALSILVFSTLVPLGVFAGASWLTRSEPNWAAPAYPSAFVLAAGFLDRWYRRGARHRKTVIGGMALAGAVTVFAQVELAFPLLPLTGGPVRKVHDRADAVACVQRLRSADLDAPVVTDGYVLASVLAFGLPDHPETYAPLETRSGSAYHAWPSPSTGTTAWYVTDGASRREVEQLFDPYVRAGACDDVRRGKTLDTWRVYHGHLAGGVP